MHVQIVGNLKQSHRICLQLPFEGLWGAQEFHFCVRSIRGVKFLTFH
jgi:hypothetical protein